MRPDRPTFTTETDSMLLITTQQQSDRSGPFSEYKPLCSLWHIGLYMFIHLFIYSLIYLFIYSYIYFIHSFIYLFVDLGGLVVSVLDPRFAGSIRTEVDGFLRVIKIRSTTSFGGEVKPSVPCRRFTACKRTLRARIEMLRKLNSKHPFLTQLS
jgi:hypothetical protein